MDRNIKWRAENINFYLKFLFNDICNLINTYLDIEFKLNVEISTSSIYLEQLPNNHLLTSGFLNSYIEIYDSKTVGLITKLPEKYDFIFYIKVLTSGLFCVASNHKIDIWNSNPYIKIGSFDEYEFRDSLEILSDFQLLYIKHTGEVFYYILEKQLGQKYINLKYYLIES